MYNKLYRKIVTSSIWLESTPTRIVWITFIALMDRDGIVQMGSVENVAHTARVTPQEAAEAIRALESPDPLNPEQEHEGRRIERVPMGWLVINHSIYQNFAAAEKIREQTRERVNAWRQRKKNNSNAGNAEVTEVTRMQCYVTGDVTPSGSGSGPLPDIGSPPEILTRVAPQVGRIFDHWRQEFGHPKARLDAKRTRLIQAALKLHPEADLLRAISGYKLSPHHMGQNDSGTVYDDIGLMLRDTAHIEAGLGFHRTAKPKLSEVEQALADLERGIHGERTNHGGVASAFGALRLGADPPVRPGTPGSLGSAPGELERRPAPKRG